MANKCAFETVDRTLRAIRGCDALMGGIPFVLAGDFRQTLPVVRGGTKADELAACIKDSYLWDHVHRMGLTTNMRAHLAGDTSAEGFAIQLLKLGEGRVGLQDGVVSMADFGSTVSSRDDLERAVFPEVDANFSNASWLCERAILAPTNRATEATNQSMLAKIPGVAHKYRAYDTVPEDEAVHFPQEFLNSLMPSGFPPYLLHLKVGSPIICLRNHNPPTLCNGFRLHIKRLTPNAIEATVLTGSAAGTVVFIPRIPMRLENDPVPLKRVQFPVRLCFSVTFNRAQGQSLGVVGLDLESPCFSHGQLYVGCSRFGSKDNLFAYVPESGMTKNIVYREALT